MKTTGNSADDLMEFLQDKKQQSDTNSSSLSEEEYHDDSSGSSGYESIASDDSSKTTTSNSIPSSIHHKKYRKRRKNKKLRSNSIVQNSSNSIISISSSSSSVTTTTPHDKADSEPTQIKSDEPGPSDHSDKNTDNIVITVNPKLAKIYPSPASVGPGYVPLALAHSSESSMMSCSKGKQRSKRYPSNLTTDDDGDSKDFDYDDVETTTSSLSSYAGSALSQDEEQFIPSQYISDRITNAMDPALLDRVIVVQAQTSGSINAKSLEIAELRKKATERLTELKAIFAEGSKIAKHVARDLEWSQKKTKYVVIFLSVLLSVEANNVFFFYYYDYIDF